MNGPTRAKSNSGDAATGPVGWSGVRLAGLLVALGLAALTIDIPIASWFRGENCPEPLLKLFSLSEVFSHGFGVTAILLVVAVLAPERRGCLPRLAAASLGAGLAANCVKLLVARARPSHLPLDGSIRDTFIDWLPLLSAGSGAQGFPSSHAATAVGLAAGLVWLSPRGRVLFPVLAVLACCQRMAVGAHFLSDTLVGAAVGSLIAAAVLPGGKLAGWFDRWETRRRAVPPSASDIAEVDARELAA